MTSLAAYPEVPEPLLAQWRELMGLVSIDCGVSAALIMRVLPEQIEVLVSDGSDSPYRPGERENLCTGLYCEHVIATHDRLLVANALTDPAWDHNPDLRLGMISYLGYPLLWPDGMPFGTLCLLDRVENHYSEAIDKRLGLARRIIESNLSLIHETAGHRQTIAALRQSEERLREAVLRANAADRAKTDFLARASHDLRAPLTSIIGYAQLLQGSGMAVTQNAQIIRHSADHMLGLIDDLVEYASGSLRDEIDVRPRQLPAFIDSLAHEAEMLARKNDNRFVLQRDDGLPAVVWMDARRVRQIVGNLIENAAKFTRQGSIELLVGHRTEGAPAGSVTLQIEVNDTGCGISAEDQPRVFEPFYRCGDKRRSEGTGLGLPIVELWVGRMGGTLQLDSTPGVGTRIRIAIPLRLGTEADLDPRQPDEEAQPAPFGGGRRLWVVEDAAETRSQLAAILEHAGFVVDCAEDGQAFIERIDAANTAPPLPRADRPDDARRRRPRRVRRGQGTLARRAGGAAERPGPGHRGRRQRLRHPPAQTRGAGQTPGGAGRPAGARPCRGAPRAGKPAGRRGPGPDAGPRRTGRPHRPRRMGRSPGQPSPRARRLRPPGAGPRRHLGRGRPAGAVPLKPPGGLCTKFEQAEKTLADQLPLATPHSLSTGLTTPGGDNPRGCHAAPEAPHATKPPDGTCTKFGQTGKTLADQRARATPNSLSTSLTTPGGDNPKGATQRRRGPCHQSDQSHRRHLHKI